LNSNQALFESCATLVLVMCLMGGTLAGTSPPGPELPSEEQQKAYRTCVQSGALVESDAQGIVPPRRWNFESQLYRRYFGELRRAADRLVADQAAFESTLGVQQKSKLDSTHSMALLQSQLESYLRNVDRELRKLYPQKWQLEADALGVRSVMRRWKRVRREDSQLDADVCKQQTSSCITKIVQHRH